MWAMSYGSSTIAFQHFHAELPYNDIYQNVKNTSFMHTSLKGYMDKRPHLKWSNGSEMVRPKIALTYTPPKKEKLCFFWGRVYTDAYAP